MNERINILADAWYINLPAVTAYQEHPNSTVSVIAPWVPLQFVKGSPKYSVNRDTTKQDKLFTSKFDSVLSVVIPFGFGLLRLDFEGGETYIIGSIELPVIFDQEQSLMQKNLSISHKSWHYPFTLAV